MEIEVANFFLKCVWNQQSNEVIIAKHANARHICVLFIYSIEYCQHNVSIMAVYRCTYS